MLQQQQAEEIARRNRRNTGGHGRPWTQRGTFASWV
eukprot:gene24721-2534_t